MTKPFALFGIVKKTFARPTCATPKARADQDAAQSTYATASSRPN